MERSIGMSEGHSLSLIAFGIFHRHIHTKASYHEIFQFLCIITCFIDRASIM